MGLRFPTDLDAWQAWQDRRRGPRAVVGRWRHRNDRTRPQAVIARNSPAPVEVLVILESRAASSRHAVLSPLAHLGGVSCAVVAPFDPADYLRGAWTVGTVQEFDPASLFPRVSAVLSAAHYLPLGALALADAEARGHSYVTVQHGLLTESAPPLPPSRDVLVWSQEDATFWTSGRADVEAHVVGSQLFWEAAALPSPPVSRFDRPVYLGQLHGAELPRAGMTRAATRFCLETGAVYRPHPSETDHASVLTHRAWRRMGIEFDGSGVPLAALGRPVVSAFSTGILEAAAQGTPAWVYYPDPPAWLVEFWTRYRMHPWGEAPTPPPERSVTEPAVAVADHLKGRM